MLLPQLQYYTLVEITITEMRRATVQVGNLSSTTYVPCKGERYSPSNNDRLFLATGHSEYMEGTCYRNRMLFKGDSKLVSYMHV